MLRIKNLFYPILLIVVSLVAIIPLLNPGFFPMHDNTQVARVFEMHKSLSDGMFPVRWVEDLGYGYGYPIFSFYAPLAYYVGAFFMFLGLSAVTATKVMIGLGLLAAGFSMYLLARQFWGQKGAVIAGAMYVLAPYHGTNVYVRGAIAEMWAYAFIPLAFYGIWQFSKAQSGKSLLLGVLGVSGVILSHNLTAMMLIPFFFLASVVSAVIKRREGKKALLPFLVLGIGLLLSSFYWVPTLSEIDYTNVSSQTGGGSDYKYHFVCLPQFWSSPVGYAGSAPGCVDGMSLQLGKVHILVLLGSIVGAALLLKKKKFLYPVVFAQIMAIAGVFLATSSSVFLWGAIPLMRYFQFPWRFETLFIVGATFCAGLLVYLFEDTFKKKSTYAHIFTVVIVLATVIFYHKFFVPQSFESDANRQSEPVYIKTVVSKVSDEYLPKNFAKPRKGDYAKTPFPSGKTFKAEILADKTQYKKASFDVSTISTYVSDIAYFPSWSVFIDSKKVETGNKEGRVSFVMPKGTHTVEAKFVSTQVEMIGDLMSLGGVFLLAVGIISFRHGKRHEK